MTTDVTTVLLDADGVLQHPGIGWMDRLVELGGPDFPEAVFAAESSVMAGGSFLATVTDLVESTGLEIEPTAVVAVWENIELDPEALAVVISYADPTGESVARNVDAGRTSLWAERRGGDARA